MEAINEKGNVQRDLEVHSAGSQSGSQAGSKEKHVDAPGEEPHVTMKAWTVVLIMSLGYGLSFVPVPTMAAVGPNIAADLGDPTSYVWYVSTWIVSITIGWMIAGANTDMLGRRWFLIMGSLICAVGHLTVGLAKNSNTIIAGMAVTGFGAALCQMATFALTELLPNKWRHIGVVLADGVVYLTITIIPITARYGYYVGDWRANFYAACVLQFLSCVGLFFIYFPPAHPLGIPFSEAIKSIDYLGIFLFIAGSLPVLLGIVWVSIYPSSNVHVVASLVVGFVILTVFALWETFGKQKYPLTPPKIFTRRNGRDFTAPCIALAVINMFYYSASIIWPTMIAYFYLPDPTDWKRASALSLPQGLGVTTGGVLLSIFGSKIRRWQWQHTVAMFVMVLFGSLLALGNPNNMGMMIAFLFLSLVGYGWSIYLCIAITQMGVEQEELGLSGGLSGCVRYAGGTIAQAVYLAIYTNTYAKYVARLVPAAATGAGLASSEVPALLSSVGTAALAKNYPTAVVTAVTKAVQEAVRHGTMLIALTSLAFGVVGIIASFFCVDVDDKMTNKIEVFLENDEYADRNKYH